MNLLTMEHLTHAYTERKILDDADFSVNEGEKIGIIGVNGTGKSTLLKSLNRMNDLVEGCRIEGKILLDGQDIYAKSMDGKG